MNLEEYAAKALVLAPSGVPVPKGRLAKTPDEAGAAFHEVGACMVKAQVPTGKRGKRGAIRPADTAEEASAAARAILGTAIDGHVVEQVLIEERLSIAQEFYLAVLPDASARAPNVLFSKEGGVDVEKTATAGQGALRRSVAPCDTALDLEQARRMLDGLDLGASKEEIARILVRCHRAFLDRDAELLEINPLALLTDGRVVALDCKFALDDSAASRQPDLAGAAAKEAMTELERSAAEAGLKFIQLDGDVGVLANGAGLTMATMDVIAHFGGRPANFLEIGGEAYTKAEKALELALAGPSVKSLVINFCGAFARTDVMVEGVVKAWSALKPKVPVFFSVHGTGEDKAVELVRRELGFEPYDLMEDAVRAAVEVAR